MPFSVLKYYIKRKREREKKKEIMEEPEGGRQR